MKVLALLFCTALLAVSAAALWPIPPVADGPAAAPQTPYLTGQAAAESAWAATLLQSLRQAETASDRSELRAQAAQALRLAMHPAPVWVSLSRCDLGSASPFSSVADLQLELDRRLQRLSPQRAVAAGNAAPADPLTSALLDALQPHLEQWRDGDERFNYLAEAILDPQAEPLLCLEAAVAADPACIVAWSELAGRSHPSRALPAAQAWRRLEPDNAAPSYYAALASLRSGAASAAVAELQTAGAAPAFRLSRLPLPTGFENIAPQDAVPGAMSGGPISPVVLSNLHFLERSATAAAATAAVWQTLAELLTQPGSQAADPQVLEPLLRQLGARLLSTPDATADEVSQGIAIVLLAASLESNVAEAATLSQFDFRLQRSTRELSSGLGRWNQRLEQLLADRDAWLSGRIDLADEERRAMQLLLSQPRLQAALAAEVH